MVRCCCWGCWCCCSRYIRKRGHLHCAGVHHLHSLEGSKRVRLFQEENILFYFIVAVSYRQRDEAVWSHHARNGYESRPKFSAYVRFLFFVSVFESVTYLNAPLILQMTILSFFSGQASCTPGTCLSPFLGQAEVLQASTYCSRWRSGLYSWRMEAPISTNRGEF